MSQTISLRATAVRVPLAAPFRISRGVEEVSDLVEVTVADGEGREGHGEGAPAGRYGEDVAGSLAWLEDVAARGALGDDPLDRAAVEARLDATPGPRAARAAVETALWDLAGHRLGIPVRRLLGLAVGGGGPPTSWTVWLGSPDEMAARAGAAAADGRFSALKLKLGAGDGRDVERVGAVRDAVGGRVAVRVDANEGWTLDEALDTIPRLAALGVELVEQPLRAGDPDGPRLRDESPLPIVLDEDCHTLGDLADCATRGHGVNLKLAKAGGLGEALRMVAGARALGLSVMVGCMVETSLGIAAAAQLAPLCDRVDLDGNLLLAEDPWTGVTLEGGVQTLSDRPGLGVERRPRVDA